MSRASSIILDDVLDQLSVDKINSVINNSTEKTTWYDLDEDHIFANLCTSLIHLTNEFINISSCVGYEFWTRLNTNVGGWHQDKDEVLYERENVLSYPLCTILYYPYIKNLKGGQLLLEDDIIMPRTNRMIIFASGMSHNVENFTGERTSMIINPWSKKL